MKIAIGHPAYGAWCFNEPKLCSSKTSAVRELCNRFVPRAHARQVVEKALKSYSAIANTTAPCGSQYIIEVRRVV